MPIVSIHESDPRQAVQDLYIEMLAFNRRNARRLGISDTDLAVLDLIHRYGTITPTELASRTHTHPATMTGILKRLEHGGWITRSRPETDRRAVIIAFQPEREDQIRTYYAQANAAIDAINQAVGPQDLAAIDAYLRQTASAIRQAQTPVDG